MFFNGELLLHFLAALPDDCVSTSGTGLVPRSRTEIQYCGDDATPSASRTTMTLKQFTCELLSEASAFMNCKLRIVHAGSAATAR